MENFAHLHLHSVYSAMDAISTPEQLIQEAVNHGHFAMALTDHGVMGGVFQMQQEALKNGIKPLIGMEGYVVKDLVNLNDKGKRVRDKNNHIVLLAKNKDGYNSLLKLNYLSNSDDNHFYYKPRFTFKELFENKNGLVISSACIASGFANLLKRGRVEEAEQLFDKFANEFREDFYAEVQLNEINFEDLPQKKYNDWLISMAKHYGIPVVLTGDVHYAKPEGAVTQEFAFNIRNDDDKDVGERFTCHSLFYQGISDFKNFNKKFGYNYSEEEIDEWCSNTLDVSKKINFLIPERTKMFLPRQAFDEDDEIVKLAKEGLVKHFEVSKFDECPIEYRTRLIEELSLIIKKGVSRYFLCLTDICEWCDKNDVSRNVGRGSVGGSLVACCLGLIKWIMDPVKNGLIFSRFISESRLTDAIIDYSNGD